MKGNIYKGFITRIDDIGCFVQLQDVKGDRQGLVHISQIQQERVSHPHDVVTRNQRVWVKVIDIIDDKIRLSMKDVDQKTGEDITRGKVGIVGKGPKHTGTGHITGIIINDPKED